MTEGYMSYIASYIQLSSLVTKPFNFPQAITFTVTSLRSPGLCQRRAVASIVKGMLRRRGEGLCRADDHDPTLRGPTEVSGHPPLHRVLTKKIAKVRLGVFFPQLVSSKAMHRSDGMPDGHGAFGCAFNVRSIYCMSLGKAEAVRGSLSAALGADVDKMPVAAVLLSQVLQLRALWHSGTHPKTLARRKRPRHAQNSTHLVSAPVQLRDPRHDQTEKGPKVAV